MAAQTQWRLRRHIGEPIRVNSHLSTELCGTDRCKTPKRLSLRAAMSLARNRVGFKGWTYGTAPDLVVRRHLMRKHGKKPSWIAENGEDLRDAHLQDHNFGRPEVQHSANDDLN